MAAPPTTGDGRWTTLPNISPPMFSWDCRRVEINEGVACVDCEDTIDGDAIHCRRCVCPHTHARQQCTMPDVNSRESITWVDCEDTIDGDTIDGDAIDGDTIDGKS